MADRMEAGGNPAPLALIVQPPVRRAIARLLAQRVPECLVLSISELPASQPIEVIAVIGVGPPTSDPSPAAVAANSQPKEFAYS